MKTLPKRPLRFNEIIKYSPEGGLFGLDLPTRQDRNSCIITRGKCIFLLLECYRLF